MRVVWLLQQLLSRYGTEKVRQSGASTNSASGTLLWLTLSFVIGMFCFAIDTSNLLIIIIAAMTCEQVQLVDQNNLQSQRKRDRISLIYTFGSRLW